MYLQRKDNKLLMKWNQNRIKSKNNIKKSQNNSERERERELEMRMIKKYLKKDVYL